MTNFDKIVRLIEALDKRTQKRGTGRKGPCLWRIGRASGEFLRMMVLATRPKNILECGTSAGYSTLFLADGARQVDAKVHTIEFQDIKIKLADKYFKKANLSKYINQVQGRVGEVLEKWNEKIDFVFFDADKKGQLSHLKKLEPKLSKSAIIISDNAGNMAENLRDYVRYVKNSSKYRSYLVDIDKGLMVSIKLK